MSDRQLPWIVAALVGGIILSWLLVVPPGAQPDEHSHLVRSGALVLRADKTDGFYVLPDRYVMTDPGCYAFDPFAPATCAAPLEHSGQDLLVLTRADDYPPGGHGLTGAATLLPGLDPVWWARLVAGVVATVFVSAAIVLALRRSRLLGGALLLALTPMAWSSLPSANPSTYAIAGATALWVALLTTDLRSRVPTATAWLIASGWAALAVSRRDGLVWACLIVFGVAVFRRFALVDLTRRLSVGPVALAGVATLVTLVWGVTSDSRTSQLVVVAPILLVVAELVRSKADAVPSEARWWLVAIGAIAGVVAWPLLVSTRSKGWDTDLVVAIVNQTDDNLVEAIGRLGWLDAPIPSFAVYAWLLAIGGAVGFALITNLRGLVAAVVLVLVAALSSWTFELLQNNDSGTYWQGRYSLPLLIGVPLLLVVRPGDRADGADPDGIVGRFGARLTVWVTITGLLVLNLGAWAAARRWGVGLDGSYLPWRWDTSLQPVPSALPLALLAACSVGLGWSVIARPERAADDPAVA
ncbi:putative membrane protein DUF2142 [Ilumatobacter fluminis]|uniref:Putative membrane protein DUF2142 n=1 Tax=Ilumatobacter fluminis TaxID=467091 RepID=A0A4R7I3X0_9ACTN|nr:DUF2142 domain-containing protein [Ilumatobacter fluminis]TDT17293.1 putative membrane protein DUF2142 [Ilumatobacter fluminis]